MNFKIIKQLPLLGILVFSLCSFVVSKNHNHENYKNDFITRYCDLLNSTFKSEKWTEETVHTKTNLEPEIELKCTFQ